MPNTTEAFDAWVPSRPPLVGTGLGDEYSPGFGPLLAARGIPDREFREAVCWATEVLYGSLFGATDETGSRQYVEDLAQLAGKYGVSFPDIEPFAISQWADGSGSGWGRLPSPEQAAVWRYGSGR